jgi:hypothetical protein
MRYWLAIERAECKAKWNGTCLSTGRIEVPDGYQICDVSFNVDSRGYEARFTTTPAKWLDGESPEKFRAYDIQLYSSGGYRVLNQQSANIKVSDLRVKFMSDRLDNAERRKRRCAMPTKPEPPPPQPIPSTPTELPWAPSSVDFIPGRSLEHLRVVMTTPTGSKNTTHIIIEYFDPLVWNRWKLHREDVISMGPGDHWDHHAFGKDATCWRVRTAYMTSTGWKPGRSYSPACNH